MVTFEQNPIIFAAVGGIILGLATSINYIIRGKVTGMSGIVYGVVSLDKCTSIHILSTNTLKIINNRRNVYYLSHFLPHFWLL